MRVILIQENELRDLLEETTERVFRRSTSTGSDGRTDLFADKDSLSSKRWLSVKEAITYTGLSRSSLQRLRTGKDLLPEKVRGRVVYDRTIIDRFLCGTRGRPGRQDQRTEGEAA